MEEEKNILVLYKNRGKFYTTIGLDSYIMSLLFGYIVLKDNLSQSCDSNSRGANCYVYADGSAYCN